MKYLYLVLAILGAALPYVFFMQHIGVAGVGISTFVAQGFANPVAAGFTTDLLISSLVFWIYMFSSREASPKPWAFIVINLFIGLSCALPAYLYWRERSQGAPAANAIT